MAEYKPLLQFQHNRLRPHQPPTHRPSVHTVQENGNDDDDDIYNPFGYYTIYTSSSSDYVTFFIYFYLYFLWLRDLLMGDLVGLPVTPPGLVSQVSQPAVNF